MKFFTKPFAVMAISAALVPVLLCGCETTSTVVADQPQTATYLPAGTEVVLLSPLVMYDSATGGGISAVSVPTSEIPVFIDDTATRQLTANGIKVVHPEDSNVDPGSQLKSACASLTSASVQLVTHPTSDQISQIKALATAEKKRAVLAHFVRIKTGPAAYWDPNSGAMGSDMSTTHVRAVMIDCATGTPLWKSQVYIRKQANIKEKIFRTSIENLYTNITTSTHL